MKLDFTRTFKTRTGKDFSFGADESGNTKIMTAGACCLIALDSIEVKISGEEKYKRYQLNKKIEKSIEVDTDFTAEEVAYLKKVTGEFDFTPFLQGLLWDFLDQKSEVPRLSAVS